MIRRTYRYRIYPTRDQERLLSDTLFLCSLVYNQCLQERTDAWRERGERLTAYDQINRLPEWNDAPPWAERVPGAPSLSIVYSQVRSEVPLRLDKAFEAFFRRVKAGEKPGYPRFRSARRYDSFTYTQSTGFRVDAPEGSRHGRLRLGKIGSVRIRLHRPIDGKIKRCTIRRQAGGWYACLSCEVEAKPLEPTGEVVGIDLGLEHWITTSDGEHIAPAKHLRAAEKRLKRAQRRVSRRQGGKGKPSSKRRKKAIRQLARAHERVANQRRDTAHKAARALVERYDLIAVEALNIQGMVRNHHLAKSISDAAWGSLLTILASKAEGAGRQVVKVDPRNTSQRCAGCGAIVPKRLKERRHHCPQCGLSLHRDVNAARNVLADALRLEDVASRSGRAGRA